MRILFVHERFGALAGAEANACATAAELKRRGHDLGLLHGPSTGRGETEWRQTFGRNCFPLDTPNPAATVRETLAEFNPELIYVHNMADPRVVEALLDGPAPAIRMVHDHDLYCMRSYKYNVLTRRICTRGISPYCVFPCGGNLKRNRDGVIPLAWVSYTKKKAEIALNRRFQMLLVATHYMKGELLRNGFDPNRVEVHPPVPPRADTLETSRFSDRNLIVYAGQITRGKGVDVLLQALSKVEVPFECLVFGDGHYRGHCEKISRRLGLSDRVHFAGFVSQAELNRFYQECSVAVVSSVWPEPFGAVGLEAMRFGVPVVAFDAGGIREWLIDGHNGYRVAWMDRERFAACVEVLLRDKARARLMGENGRELIRRQFSFPKYIGGLEDLIHRIIAASSPRFHSSAPSGPVTGLQAETQIVNQR